jgi:hypothetical protein
VSCEVCIERRSLHNKSGCRGSQSNSPTRRRPGRNDNGFRLVLMDREAAGGRNKYRGIRGVGVECLWCQAFQRRSWPLFRRVCAGDAGGMSGGRGVVVVDGMVWRC